MLTRADPSKPSQEGLLVAGSSPRTLADVQVQLDRDRDLDDRRRSSWAGAIRTMCSVLKQPPEAIPAAMSEIKRLLDEVPDVLRGRSRKTVNNTRSRLNAALMYVAADRSLPPRGAPLTPEWEALKAQLPEERHKKGLTRLMRFASYHGIAPTEMSDDAMSRLTELVGKGNWGRDVLPFHRDTITLWNECRSSIAGWPDIALTPPVFAGRPSHLPLTAFPDSFQRDLQAYLEWESGADPFAEDAPPKALRKTTLNLRANHLRAAASHLARALGGPEHVADLKTLVHPTNVRAVFNALVPKDSVKDDQAHFHSTAITLITVAKRWVKADDASIKELQRMKQRVKAPTGMTKKNRELLIRLDDPKLVKALLDLPDRLRRRVEVARRNPARRLSILQTALAIDILLVAPLRIHNLMELQLDQHLRWPNGRGGALYLSINPDETKNDQRIEFTLPEHLARLVAEFVDRVRDPGRGFSSKLLFVTSDGQPVTEPTMRDRITKAIFRETRLHMTPHQFRHLAAKLILDATPDAIYVVSALLGHKNIKTTIAMYAGMRTLQAAAEYDKVLTGLRTHALTQA